MDSVRKKSTKAKVIDFYKKRVKAVNDSVNQFKKNCSTSWTTTCIIWWDKVLYTSLIAYILCCNLIIGTYLFKDQVTLFKDVWTHLDGTLFWSIICAPFIVFLLAFIKIKHSLQGESFWTKVDVRRGFFHAYTSEFTANTFLPGFIYKSLLIPLIIYASSLWPGWITLSDFTRDDWYKWLVLILLNGLAAFIALYDIQLREMLHGHFKEWIKANHIAVLSQFESSLIANFYERCGGYREIIALPILKVTKGDNATQKTWLGKSFYDHIKISVTLFYKKVSFDTLEEESPIDLDVEEYLQAYYFANNWKATKNNGSSETNKKSNVFKKLIGEDYFVGGLAEILTCRQIKYDPLSWDKDRIKSFNEQLSYKKIYYQSIESINYSNNGLQIQAQGSTIKIPLYTKDAAGSQELTKQIYDIIHPQKSHHECYT